MKTIEFKIFGWLIRISIKKLKAAGSLDGVVELLMREKKLAALKEMKTIYDIHLKEGKEILDRILVIDYSEFNTSNRPKYDFLIKKNKKTIRRFLRQKLYKYERL